MKKQILIVEDDQAQQLLYEIEIAEMGFEVLLASDGIEALRVLQEQKPDAIVLDLVLPHQDGLETLPIIGKICPGVPVIIHSAYSHLKEHFATWSAEEYVVKSANLSDLKHAIQRVLNPTPIPHSS